MTSPPHVNALTADRTHQENMMDYEERQRMWWQRYRRYPRDYAYYYSSQMQRKCCIQHKRKYREACSSCVVIHRSRTQEEEIDAVNRVRMFRNKLYKEADLRKHADESCASCDKHIAAEEWFCYCSLCPDCYMQIPEEELDKIDKQIEELANKSL